MKPLYAHISGETGNNPGIFNFNKVVSIEETEKNDKFNVWFFLLGILSVQWKQLDKSETEPVQAMQPKQ